MTNTNIAEILRDAALAAHSHNESNPNLTHVTAADSVSALLVLELREQNKLIATQNEILRDGIRELVGAIRGRE